MTRQSLNRMLRWGSLALIGSALSAFTYCAFVLTEAWFFQKQQLHTLEVFLADRKEAVSETASPAVLHTPLPPVRTEGLIGRLKIKRLGLAVMVVEGADAATLRHAVGHIPGTALPGAPGNTGLSGHRDTYFRSLEEIKQHDTIEVTTVHGIFQYRVVTIKIVPPNDVTVLESAGTETLTLVTCHPFDFVGSAPMRFIVQAERILPRVPSHSVRHKKLTLTPVRDEAQ